MSRDAGTPVLEVTDLVKHFSAGSAFSGGSATVKAVDGVSLTIGQGQILGLVGESGSGKSTVGRCVTRLVDPTSGSIKLLGTEISTLSRKQMRSLRREVHIVFQDPYSSLNPRMTIAQIVAEPLRLHKIASGAVLEKRVADMLARTGLRPEMADRFPHELSGGQRQRVGLARALALEPALLIADEPVSALDVSVQASILNLITDLQQDMGFSCLFITHDLSVVEFISDAIAVMYLGRVVETAARTALFRDPQHPYTQSLLSAAPVPDPGAQRSRERIVLVGDMPSPLDPPPGCTFHTRCPVAVDRCRTEVPPLVGVTAPDHPVACHLVDPQTGRPDVAAARTGTHPAADSPGGTARVHDQA